MQMNHRLLNKYLFLFNAGGLLYILIELIWRGRSHWTMFLLGGICFVFLGLINEVLPWQMPLWQQILVGAVGITTLEFLTGCIVKNLQILKRCRGGAVDDGRVAGEGFHKLEGAGIRVVRHKPTAAVNAAQYGQGGAAKASH